VSPVRYELGFYIPEDALLHSHRRENLKSYTIFKTVSGSGTAVSRSAWLHREVISKATAAPGANGFSVSIWENEGPLFHSSVVRTAADLKGSTNRAEHTRHETSYQ
jgi:hypothetical protein